VDAPADTLPPTAGKEPPVPAETFDVPPVVAVPAVGTWTEVCPPVAVPPDVAGPDDGLLGPLQAATQPLIAIEPRWSLMLVMSVSGRQTAHLVQNW
jgi:hypothetical protein